jgi:hypothetical protein
MKQDRLAKPRIFMITSNPPMDEMGGCVILHRQFVEKNDYDLFVVTDRLDDLGNKFPWMRYRLPKIVQRLQKTRFSKFIYDFVHLSAIWWIPLEIEKAARQFRPDIVLIGAETPIADFGVLLAKKLKVPLAGHFMDWPTFSIVGHKWISKYASHRFRARYHACQLAFGICPEMLNALGSHPNAHVFYPSGPMPGFIPKQRTRKLGEPFRLLFAGNLGQWYGGMVLSLAKTLSVMSNIRFTIAGKNAAWSEQEKQWLYDKGIYVGYKKGNEYNQLFIDTDCLLVCMGFSEDARLIESTSFKSKFVDYLVSGRPIVVWGPEYCTAIRHAKKYGFAEFVTDHNPETAKKTVLNLAGDQQRCEGLVRNALKFFESEIDANIVFKRAYKEKCKLISRSTPA